MPDRATRGRILVFGVLFWYPLAGVTYQFLHYLLGLRKLGFDAWYVEDSSRYVYDPRLDDLTPDPSANIQAVRPALDRFGLGDRWAFRGAYEGGRTWGLDEGRLRELYRTADALLNVTGAQELREEHLSIPRRIYVESDPFATQVKVAKGDAVTTAQLDAHDTHFTFGENIGQPDCLVPIARYTWLPTRQPVDLDLWPASPVPDHAAFRTITTWHNEGKDIDWQGEKWYWTKDRQFERVLDLPSGTSARLELATRVSEETRARLTRFGWHLADALPVSADVDAYSSYIRGSLGEFTVARDQYVRPRTGWFSDRSACYLASGRPVVTEETGFSSHVPSGRGLFSFTNPAEAASAIEAVMSDPAAHGTAAREIAAEYFDAERVLTSLIDRAGL